MTIQTKMQNPRVVVCIFGALASWLLGFLASWLLGFLASWLLGFLASWLLGFLLVYAGFGGFLALVFCFLCIPSSNQVAFAAFCWVMRLLVALALRILCFPSSPPLDCFLAVASSASPVPPHLNHHFFEHHGGGCRPPPQPPAPFWTRCFLYSIAPFLESLHPYLNHHFFEHHGGGRRPPPPPPTPPLLFRISAEI